MGQGRGLRKIPVFCGVDVVEQAGKLPVPGRVGNAGYPAHEGEGQHFVAVSVFDLCFNQLFFPVGDAGHHVGQVSRRQEEEVFYPFIVIS